MGPIEACESDQNWVVVQVAAYTTYLNSTNRGRGLVVFELAYRNMNVIGSSQDFLNAINLALSQNMKYEFCQKEPLNGDIRTKIVKRKTPTKGFVGDRNSHRLDTTLLTSPITHNLKH